MKKFRRRSIERFVETTEWALLQIEYHNSVVVVFVDQILSDCGIAKLIVISGFLPEEDDNGSVRLYEKDLSSCCELRVLTLPQAEDLRRNLWLHQLIRQCNNTI